MKQSLNTMAMLALASTLQGSQAADFINGNWYGSPVDAISYTNWGLPGSYNKITDMSNGQCKSTPQGYAGGVAPLDGEISWHFRGPLNLKQFAFYAPGSSSNAGAKRDAKPTPHQRRHNHAHLHARKAHAEENSENEKRAVGDWVTATINGQVASWINEYGGAAAEATPVSAPAVAVAAAVTTSAAAAVQSKEAHSAAAAINAGAGNWGRQAYYNAEAAQADGLVFLNNRGGAGSGVFDYTWGMSLSYASADGKSGASSPQVLQNSLLEDNTEVAIFTDKQCSGNDCGTVRPGTVAYHGFDGASKLFLLEFDMPLSGQTGFNADMPAAWILNAQIPRTMQYGQAECSCWTSGCGEWDIYEVLDSGNTRCKSTFHGLRAGGESDYFPRPTSKTVKVAVVFDGVSQAGHIVVLDDATTFDTTISDSTVSDFLNKVVAANKPHTTFVLPS